MLTSKIYMIDSLAGISTAAHGGADPSPAILPYHVRSLSLTKTAGLLLLPEALYYSREVEDRPSPRS